MEEKIYTPKEFSKKLRISVRTLQRWDNEGKLVARRTPSNRRFYTEEDFQKYLEMSKKPEEK